MAADDETEVSEITILPDGRVYVFGMSEPVLETVRSLRPDDARLRRLAEEVHARAAAAAADGTPAKESP